LVSQVDASALRFLNDLQKYFKAKDITLCLSSISQAVMHRLVLSGVADKIGVKNMFDAVDDAAGSCLRSLTDFDQENP